MEPALRFPVGAIRNAIRELLEGSIAQDSLRKLECGVFKYGTFDGQPLEAEQAYAAQTQVGRHWFNVRLGRVRRNLSTQFSAMGSYRVANVGVTIEVTTKGPSTVEEEARDEVLALVGVDLEQACAALGYPGNLDEDVAGDDTNIVSGCLVGPSGDGAEDVEYEAVPNWDEGLVRSRIDAVAIVQIAQEV